MIVVLKQMLTALNQRPKSVISICLVWTVSAIDILVVLFARNKMVEVLTILHEYQTDNEPGRFCQPVPVELVKRGLFLQAVECFGILEALCIRVLG